MANMLSKGEDYTRNLSYCSKSSVTGLTRWMSLCKESTGGIKIPAFKLQCKATLKEIASYWEKNQTMIN